MVSALRRGVLDGVQPIRHGGAVSVAVAPPLARFIIHGGADAAALAGAAFGTSLPTLPCRAAVAGSRAALWLGPDEWLLLAPPEDPVVAALPACLGETPGAVVDVSNRHAALHLAGTEAATVLNGACPLDLHPRAFPEGMCTRTIFAKAEIILWRQSDRFHLEVARSFAPYVHALLAEIALDFAT